MDPLLLKSHQYCKPYRQYCPKWQNSKYRGIIHNIEIKRIAVKKYHIIIGVWEFAFNFPLFVPQQTLNCSVLNKAKRVL